MNPDTAPGAEEEKQETEELKALPHQIKPVRGFDTYVPEDKTLHESIGIYRVYDRNGTPRVQYDHTPAEEKEKEEPETASHTE